MAGKQARKGVNPREDTCMARKQAREEEILGRIPV